MKKRCVVLAGVAVLSVACSTEAVESTKTDAMRAIVHALVGMLIALVALVLLCLLGARVYDWLGRHPSARARLTRASAQIKGWFERHAKAVSVLALICSLAGLGVFLWPVCGGILLALWHADKRLLAKEAAPTTLFLSSCCLTQFMWRQYAEAAPEAFSGRSKSGLPDSWWVLHTPAAEVAADQSLGALVVAILGGVLAVVLVLVTHFASGCWLWTNAASLVLLAIEATLLFKWCRG
jgi:hypothetical protein